MNIGFDCYISVHIFRKSFWLIYILSVICVLFILSCLMSIALASGLQMNTSSSATVVLAYLHQWLKPIWSLMWIVLIYIIKSNEVFHIELDNGIGLSIKLVGLASWHVWQSPVFWAVLFSPTVKKINKYIFSPSCKTWQLSHFTITTTESNIWLFITWVKPNVFLWCQRF